MKGSFCCINVKIHNKFLQSRLCSELLLQMSFQYLKCLVYFNAFSVQINKGDTFKLKGSYTSRPSPECSLNIPCISTCAQVQGLCKALTPEALDQIIDNTWIFLHRGKSCCLEGRTLTRITVAGYSLSVPNSCRMVHSSAPEVNGEVGTTLSQAA